MKDFIEFLEKAYGEENIGEIQSLFKNAYIYHTIFVCKRYKLLKDPDDQTIYEYLEIMVRPVRRPSFKIFFRRIEFAPIRWEVAYPDEYTINNAELGHRIPLECYKAIQAKKKKI